MRTASRQAMHGASLICAIVLALAAVTNGCDHHMRQDTHKDPPPVLEDPRPQVTPAPDIGVTPAPQPGR
jgi:hypothetical protein